MILYSGMGMQKIAVSALCLLLVNCLAAGDVPAAGQDMQFAVQTETLSFEPAARAVVNRLTAHGYAAYFESHPGSDGKVAYKVRFGRFATRAEADAAAQAYRSREQRDCFVVQVSSLSGTNGSLSPEGPREEASPDPAVKAVAAMPGSAQTSLPRQAQAGPAPVQMRTQEFYTVQIAAKSDSAVAQAFATELQRKGYPAYVLPPDPVDAKKLHRIRFGSYETRAQAEQAGRSYTEREQGDFLVVLSPPGRTAGTVAAVPTEATSAPASAVAQVFTVQVCVRETRESAEKYAEQVRAKGFEPYITRYEASNGKVLYRVRMGSFQDRSRAEELARAYEQQGGRDYLVVRTEQEMPLSDGPVPDAPPAIAEELPAVPEPEIVPEPAPEIDGPAQAPAVTAQAPDMPAPDALPVKPEGWPETVVKVYAYRGTDNELNLTNAYANIPKQLQGRIQYVSIFPVMLLEVPETGSAFVMEVEGVRRMVRLEGIILPAESRAQAAAGIRELLSAEPMRLKYAPAGERSDLLTGSLYYRAGADVQIELIKRGLALVDESSVPAGRYDAFQEARKRARDLKAGTRAADPAEAKMSGGGGADVEPGMP